MNRFPSVLCPVDFSDASRVALGHAAAIGNHFGAEITVLTVVDPFVAALAATEATETKIEDETEEALRRYCHDALAHMPPGPRSLRLRYAVGSAATEILREADTAHADLIVMSSHGHRGLRKMFFGSTTERVLRETHVPVLITPASKTEVLPLSELAGHIHEVVVPVDLTEFSDRQLKVAAAIADAAGVPLMITHVLKPPAVPLGSRWVVAELDPSPLERAQQHVTQLQASLPARVRSHTLVSSGEPSEEIVRLAESRDANLIVMGLHSSGLLGPRMGSVTYRVLSTTNAFVLALPPHVPVAVTHAPVLTRATA
jgi:nucleotide-binding universal stress UspA family protein